MIPKFLVEMTEACRSTEAVPRNLFQVEVRPNETVLGTMSEELQHLFAFRDGLHKEVRKLTEDAVVECMRRAFAEVPSENDPEHKEAHAKLDLLASKADVVEKVFWQTVREEFPAATGSIGIREGATVVSIPEERMSRGLLLDALLANL